MAPLLYSGPGLLPGIPAFGLVDFLFKSSGYYGLASFLIIAFSIQLFFQIAEFLGLAWIIYWIAQNHRKELTFKKACNMLGYTSAPIMAFFILFITVIIVLTICALIWAYSVKSTEPLNLLLSILAAMETRLFTIVVLLLLISYSIGILIQSNRRCGGNYGAESAS